MKIKSLLVLAVSLLYSISAIAQLPMQNAINNLNLKNKPSGNPTFNLLQNAGGTFNIFGESKSPSFNNSLPFSKLAAHCSDSDLLLAPNAAPCNGVSVTSISFLSTSRSVVPAGIAGSTGKADNTVGVVYKYANAGTAPDGTTSVDAYVTVLNYNNNQDTDETNFTAADLFGDETVTNGYNRNLQPNINQESATFVSGRNWNAQITYQINFYVAGTTTPIRLTVAAESIDNDGANTCGGLKESVTYNAGSNQILINTPANTFQSIAGNVITSTVTTGNNGIDPDNKYSNAALFVNVSQFTWSYSFATAGTCGSGASPRRLGSLNLTCQVTFDRNFASTTLGGNVYNDTDGLTNNSISTVGAAAATRTNAGGLFANLVDANGYVVSSAAVPSTGIYSFPTVVAGSYTVQISKTQGIESSLAPAKTLPDGWANTGERFGIGTGTDGTVDGSLAVTVGTTAVTNVNFGIEKIPVANDKTETIQNNPGGTTNVTVSPTMFTGSDTTPGAVTNIRITAFPTNATTITINGVVYGATAGPGITLFPPAGVTIPAGANGNPAQTISVDPIDGVITVPIHFVTIDDAGMASSPDVSAATVNIPFQLAPTAAGGDISGTLSFGGNPVRNALVVLIDTASNSRVFARTDANGNYLFDEKTVGKTYLVQPLSSKYAFTPGTSVVNLVDNALGLNFDSTAKKYHPKNDFDGDGQSDIAVYRPAGGNWYVLKSSDGQLSSFQFGSDTDIPVSGDFDGDGKTDYAVFRPENGVWYIWQSKTQDLRTEQFGLATDKLVSADYDGDGKDDIAVYRNGNWYIRRSSDGAFEAKSYGADTDTPITGDFDGDGKADLTVFRPENGVWYTLQSSNEASSAKVFGLATDIPLSGDFDGDGRADSTQFRNGFWYILNSTTDFEASRFGASDGKSIVGDYDGDGRADTTTFRDGLWSIYNSGSGTVRNVYFGFPTDIPIK